MLTAETLRTLLNYDPETGLFTWTSAAGPQLAGRRAGSKRTGGYTIAIDRNHHSAAKLAFLYVTGEMPTVPVRFNNGDRLDFRFENLRLSKPNSARRQDIAQRKGDRASLKESARALTQAEIHRLLSYDPETGVFLWREPGSGRVIGQPAGTVWANGYRSIHIGGRDIAAQRLAWIYVHGEIPEGQRIKFDDEDQRNLRIGNLRLALTKQEQGARFRERHPDANRRYNYTKLYQGMTIPAFDALLESQGGVCAICDQPEKDADNTGTGKIRNLNVDHDHDTNAVRGILCSACNRGLGLFADNPARLQKAKDYLERHMKKKAA